MELILIKKNKLNGKTDATKIIRSHEKLLVDKEMTPGQAKVFLK